MNINERISNETEKTMKLMETISNNIRVSSPAIIEEFDPITMTVSCRIAIKENLIDKKTNEVTPTEISILVDVPIIIPTAGNYAITLPIKKGDECLVVFGDKCINSWWANGGVQNQEETRTHDLSDGFAILGVKSIPNVLSNYSDQNLEIRNLEGNKRIVINENDILIENNSSNIEIKNNQIVIDAISIEINGTLKINGSDYLSHKHSGVQTGSGQTGGVV